MQQRKHYHYIIHTVIYKIFCQNVATVYSEPGYDTVCKEGITRLIQYKMKPSAVLFIAIHIAISKLTKICNQKFYVNLVCVSSICEFCMILTSII